MVGAIVVWAAAASALAQPGPLTLDVLTFNTALLPEGIADTDQRKRAARMAPHLVGYDVVVLQELFVNRWRAAILDALTDAYPYRSELVGEDGAGGLPWIQDGGVVILSRWPIERQAAMTYGTMCSGSDCLADKGVAYVAVRVGDGLVHVFGTHAQSAYGGRVAADVRARQFALLRVFVAEQRIPADEPVVLAGDLNVDAYTDERARMLTVLDATWPPVIGARRHTWDPTDNAYARGPREWLDYVLVANDHLAPSAAWNRVVALRDEGLDLSDHFAVWGRLVWPR